MKMYKLIAILNSIKLPVPVLYPVEKKNYTTKTIIQHSKLIRIVVCGTKQDDNDNDNTGNEAIHFPWHGDVYVATGPDSSFFWCTATFLSETDDENGAPKLLQQGH